MPQELQIIRASEFIRMNAQGHFDLGASKAALAELVRACRKRAVNQAMVDLRLLPVNPKPVFSPADVAELVRTFHEVGFTPQQRLAVLYGSDPHRRARMFAFLSTMHGWAVKAFGDFEEALFWLLEGQDAGSEIQVVPEEQQIPLQFERDAMNIRTQENAPRQRRKRKVGRGANTLSRAGRRRPDRVSRRAKASRGS